MILSRLNSLRDTLKRRKVRRGYRRKIARLLASLEPPLAVVDPTAMSIRRRFPGYRNTDWHVAFTTLSGVASSDYVPEDLFYTVIERSLNDPVFAVAYHDKASLGFLLEPDDFVGNAFFRLDGRYYDGDGRGVDLAAIERWLADQTDVVVKPARITGGGRGVVIGPPQQALQELRTTRHPVVVQQAFRQHPDIARFNADSVNTTRFMSLRLDGSIHVVSAVLRQAAAGSRIDNVTRGAVGVGIDETGRLRRYGVDIALRLHETHPTAGLRFAGVAVPCWDRVLDLAARCHQRFLEADLISWDLSVGADDIPRVIEANVMEQELNGHQILNGPVFAPFLDAILARVPRR